MISKDDVQKLATLARIKLHPGEDETLAKDMENILGYVKQIQNIPDLDTGSDTAQEKVRNVLRSDDSSHESGIHTDVLLNEAPDREGNYLKVKKVL